MLTVATALPFEARDFGAALGGTRRELGHGWVRTGSVGATPVQLVVSGPGGRRVAAAADALQEKPSVLISAGVAGALRDELSAGLVVVADSVSTLRSSARSTDPGFRRRAQAALTERGVRWRSDRCLGVDEVLASEAAKREAARQSGAGVVQMEDHVWAARAAAWGVPFLSLRVVLDAVDREVPEAAMLLPWRGPSAVSVIRVLARRPHQIPALFALGRAQSRARRALATALHAVVGEFARDAAGRDPG